MEHTVLLVDDEPRLLEALKRALRREPYTVLEATCAAEAFKVLASAPVDVIVSDEKMPGMCGTDMLAKVRREYPDVVRIILTGHANLEAAIRAINQGEVYRFLTKPFNHTDLAVTIRHALQQKTLMDEARRLLRTVKRQADLLEEIEHSNPGITELRTTPDGAIVIDDDLPGDYDEFMKELNARVEQAERILDRKDQPAGARPAPSSAGPTPPSDPIPSARDEA
jgi:two-component system probable response regulator PhcQ